MRIRAQSVRLIDEAGGQLGVMSHEEALRIASERGLDLVEVAAQAAPPVCRIMDYGKFKYQQRKKEQQARKKKHTVQMKELRVRPQTEEHDLQVKLKHAREFLQHGHRVQVTLSFRGREIVHRELGKQLLARMQKDLEDVGKIEGSLMATGPRITMNLIPK